MKMMFANRSANINGAHHGIVVLLMSTVLFMLACHKDDDVTHPGPGGGTGGPQLPAVPFDYTTVVLPAHLAAALTNDPLIDNTPADNPITNAGATLGRVLYYDKHLSVNDVTACATCHHQDKAFTDGLVVSEGHLGGQTRRNAMPTVNARYFRAKKMFWDMRADDLETQVLMPITDAIEMGMPSLVGLETKLAGLPYYPPLFEAAFGDATITSDRISKALAQFVRSIVSVNSRYDDGVATGFVDLTPEEEAGRDLVINFDCVECHSDLTTVVGGSGHTFLVVDNSGMNTGFGANNGLDLNYLDNGIGEITGLAQDQGTFKMPSLRNVALTGPYMHDGRFATLEEVLNHYATGIQAHPNRGVQMPPGGLPLNAAQQAAIVAFLHTLTDEALATDVRYSDPF
ncbi:MAG: cytochrome c peroxidase [Flavobacteriales bacterium]